MEEEKVIVKKGRRILKKPPEFGDLLKIQQYLPLVDQKSVEAEAQKMLEAAQAVLKQLKQINQEIADLEKKRQDICHKTKIGGAASEICLKFCGSLIVEKLIEEGWSEEDAYSGVFSFLSDYFCKKCPVAVALDKLSDGFYEEAGDDAYDMLVDSL